MLPVYLRACAHAMLTITAPRKPRPPPTSQLERVPSSTNCTAHSLIARPERRTAAMVRTSSRNGAPAAVIQFIGCPSSRCSRQPPRQRPGEQEVEREDRRRARHHRLRGGPPDPARTAL